MEFADQVRGVGLGIPNNISESTRHCMIGNNNMLRYSNGKHMKLQTSRYFRKENHINWQRKRNYYERLHV